MTEPSDLELLDALGVKPEPKKKAARSPQQERIVAGFEDVQRFYQQHGRAPLHGEERDIFERLYAVRLGPPSRTGGMPVTFGTARSSGFARRGAGIRLGGAGRSGRR